MCGTGWMLGDWPRWDMDDVELILASDNARTLRFRSAQALSLWDLGTIVCHSKLRQCGSFAGVMELRTSVSSVFSARTGFLSRSPRKWDTQISTQLGILPYQHQLRCSCAASESDAQDLKPVLRRTVVSLMSTLLVAAATSSAGAKPMMPMMVEPDLPRFRKTPTGVRIQEVVDGSGPEAKTGDTLEFDFVCRRSNGYFVYSTVDQFNDQSRPAVLPLGTGKIIPGLEEVLAGMRPGGKRRALIPPEVGYTDPSLEPQPREFGPRRALMSHAKEPLVFEVQLIKIK
ncbi:hypothetical protein M758_5G169100 [Ceratodon purpureus]|nr:hypothetical protein M758_5G169100 [Ceratodon purpureus]